MIIKFITLFYMAFFVFANDKVVEVSQKDEKIDLIPYVQVAHTNGNFPEVFQDYKLKRINRDYSSKTMWFKFQIHNKSRQFINKVINFTSGTIGHTQLYKEEINELKLISDSYKTRGESVFNHLNLELFPYERTTIYVRIQSMHHLNSKMILSSNRVFFKEEAKYSTLYSFYLGVLIAILIYNFLVFIFTRDFDFLNYILFLSFMGLTVLTINGYLENFLLKVSVNRHLGFFSSATVLFFFIFSYHFLNFKKHAKWMRYALFASMFTSLLCMTVNLTPLYVTYTKIFGKIIDLNIAISVLIVLCVSIKIALKDNEILAKIYIISWIFLFSSVFVWFGIYLGVSPYNFYTQHALTFGNMSEMIILSLGLAYKINILKQETKDKEKYQKLVRVLSHDIANSLFIILGQLKLSKKRQDTSFHEKDFKKIERAAKHIEDILKNVKYEQSLDKLDQIELEEVSINECLNSAIEIFEDKIVEKNISFDISIPNEILKTLANKSILIHQIFSNIISNAIKFSPKDGHIYIGLKKLDKTVEVSIQDEGIGIPGNLLKKISLNQDVFSTIGTDGEKGSGFGLYLVKSYLKLFKANFQIKSGGMTEQKGTEVIITFKAL